jgi:preprotein translocase subunit SecA
MDTIGIDEGQPIEHKYISRAIENAQTRVEGQNFDIRKHLLEYDDVMNNQRKVIYEQRKKALRGEGLWSDVEEMVEEISGDLIEEFTGEKKHPQDWDLKSLEEALYKQFNLRMDLAQAKELNSPEALKSFVVGKVLAFLKDKEQEFGADLMAYLMKVIMLQAIDSHWKEHLLSMDHLREGIGLRGYGQKDPVREYQREGYAMFMEMISRIKMDTLEKLCLVRIQKEEEVEEIRQKQKQDYVLSRGEDTPAKQTIKREGAKVGRNDPCPCGSGKKYKKMLRCISISMKEWR